MNSLDVERRHLTLAWALLVVVTAVAVLAHEFLDAGPTAVVVVLGATFVKVWLVGHRFMELRDAPPALRRLFDGYVVVVPLVLGAILIAG